MALPMPANVRVDIYRTANPADPYHLGPAGPQGVPGYLKPRVATGRQGSASWLRWTHVLYLNPNVDIRDAYNSQLDPARDDTIADTVIVADPADRSKRTAFYVVFVELALRGSGVDHLRVYLDRFQPESWPTGAL
ncbi:MAG: hypothetical protein KatS3mg105_1244 [Gemmatales bacterium]|nr:MAG: hypothetical protein KatS3mg105_1244 [Gemmatales bacterium]